MKMTQIPPKALLVLLFLISGFQVVFSSPFIRVYGPSEYKADPQTYCSVQSPDGIMYFGNNRGGVLEFDGKNWNFIDTPHNGVVRSLTVGYDRRVYVGGTGNFGFLKKDSTGKTIYHSLVHLLNESDRNFKEVWQTVSLNNQICFLTINALFIYDNGLISVIRPQVSTFSNMFSVDNEIYLVEENSGLKKILDKKLTVLSQNPLFKTNDIPFGFKTPGGKVVLITERQGLFELTNGKPVFIDCPASAYLKNYNSYLQPIHLKNGNIAIPTIRGGVLIIDQNGAIVYRITEQHGLPSNIVYSVYTDHEDGLWVTGEQGISRVEYPSPWSYYNKNNGLKGIVLSIHISPDVLYAGTMFGLFTANLKQHGKSDKFDSDLEFKQVPEVSGEVWHLEKVGNSILAASSEGLFQLINGRINKICSENLSVLQVSKKFPGIIFGGSPVGFFVYHYNQDRIRLLGKAIDANMGIYSLNEDKNGHIWSGSFFEGVYKFSFISPDWLKPHIEHYDTSNGLPAAENFTSELNGYPVILTVKGVFKKNNDKSGFELLNSFPNELVDASSILKQSTDSSVWVTNASHVQKVTFSKTGSFHIKFAPFNRLPLGGIWSISETSGGITWFGGDNGIFSFNPFIDKNSSAQFFTHIRSVISDSGRVVLSDSTSKTIPALPWALRNLQFHYSSTTFDGDGKTEYQFRLMGFSNQWSNWTIETAKEYTNLPAGDYQFEVRSKNVYGSISPAAVTSFSILPAWYSTWWARTVYLLVSLICIYLFIQWRIAKTKEEKQLLEKLVFEKTSELAASYQQLKQSQTQLIQSEKMASLGTLVAGIAHEINNPVNFIQSSIYPLKEDVNELLKYLNLYHTLEVSLNEKSISIENQSILRELKSLRDSLSPDELKIEIEQLFAGIENGTSRTSDIVKSLRTFSRVDENDMKTFDLSEGFSITLKLLEKETSGRIEIKTVFNHTSMITGFPGQINQVLMNVLLNAIQSISESGVIEVVSSETEDFVILSITDTGIGIPEENLSKLFDPFFTTKPVGKGTGLGLSISYQIIQRHRGNITVTSEPGKGSCFKIMLPKSQKLIEGADEQASLR